MKCHPAIKIVNLLMLLFVLGAGSCDLLAAQALDLEDISPIDAEDDLFEAIGSTVELMFFIIKPNQGHRVCGTAEVLPEQSSQLAYLLFEPGDLGLGRL